MRSRLGVVATSVGCAGLFLIVSFSGADSLDKVEEAGANWAHVRLSEIEEKQRAQAKHHGDLNRAVIQGRSSLHILARRLPLHDDDMRPHHDRIEELYGELRVLREELRVMIESHPEYREQQYRNQEAADALAQLRLDMGKVADERARLEAKLEAEKEEDSPVQNDDGRD